MNDTDKKYTVVSYKTEQVQHTMDLVLGVFDANKVPMPLAVLAIENILDDIQKSGVVFSRGPRLVPK